MAGGGGAWEFGMSPGPPPVGFCAEPGAGAPAAAGGEGGAAAGGAPPGGAGGVYAAGGGGRGGGGGAPGVPGGGGDLGGAGRAGDQAGVVHDARRAALRAVRRPGVVVGQGLLVRGRAAYSGTARRAGRAAGRALRPRGDQPGQVVVLVALVVPRGDRVPGRGHVPGRVVAVPGVGDRGPRPPARALGPGPALGPPPAPGLPPFT